MNAQLTYLSPKNLYHHPNNPRREYKNVDELADSIRVMGVLQNLTVVRYDPAIHAGVSVNDPGNAYIVIIGNRRLEGALKANVDTVPCIVAEMSLVEQITAMEVENGLREDADPAKQAANYQLMLDLGETVESISDKTGFSQTTIRNRIKLLDLDQDKLAEADLRGGSLSDYAKLGKLHDPKLKNQVLEYVGTDSFQAELKRAMEAEKKRTYAQTVKDVLSTFAQEVEPGTINGDEWAYSATYAWWNKSLKPAVPEDSAVREYIYMSYGEEIRLYRKRSEGEKAEISEKKRLREEQEKANAELEEAALRAFELRQDFVYNYPSAKAKKNFAKISAFAGGVILQKASSYTYFDHAMLGELLGVAYDDATNRVVNADFAEAMEKRPEYGLLALMCCYIDHNRQSYAQVRYNNDCQYAVATHKENRELDAWYDFLISLGYAMSDEEKALRDGTHPLFQMKGDKENTDAA